MKFEKKIVKNRYKFCQKIRKKSPPNQSLNKKFPNINFPSKTAKRLLRKLILINYLLQMLREINLQWRKFPSNKNAIFIK